MNVRAMEATLAHWSHFNINLLDSYSNIIKMASQRIKYIGRNREKKRSHQGAGKKLAPAPGFEPGTKWLTATYSTAELCRSVLHVPERTWRLRYCWIRKKQVKIREKHEKNALYLIWGANSLKKPGNIPPHCVSEYSPMSFRRLHCFSNHMSSMSKKDFSIWGFLWFKP